jgi:hypothetical protein
VSIAGSKDISYEPAGTRDVPLDIELSHSIPSSSDLFPLRWSDLEVIVHLWTNTSRKALVKRRFFRSYPHAVAVVILHEKAPAEAQLA